jgi:hypothetical protein
LIELAEGIWIDPFSVAVIKSADEGSCVLWTRGQSALDGFVIPYPGEEVAQAINDALEDDGEELDTEDVE